MKPTNMWHRNASKISLWTCHCCGDSGHTTFVESCGECHHLRCTDCEIYLVNIRSKYSSHMDHEVELRPESEVKWSSATRWQPSAQVSSSPRKLFHGQPRDNFSDSSDYPALIPVEDTAYYKYITKDQIEVDPKPPIITRPLEDQGKLKISDKSTRINLVYDVDKQAVASPKYRTSQASLSAEKTAASTPGHLQHSSAISAFTKDIESPQAGQNLQFLEYRRATPSSSPIIEKEENLKNVESKPDDMSSRPLMALSDDLGSCDKCGTLTSYHPPSCDKCNVTSNPYWKDPTRALNISRSPSLDSINESVLSELTVSSSSTLDLPGDANERFNALLLGDIVIKESCQRALTRLEPDKFERKLRGLLTRLASELRMEAATKPQRHAASFVKYHARNSAYIICDSLKKELEPQLFGNEAKFDVTSDSDDSDSVHSESEFDDLKQHEDFIKNSKAFKVFVERVQKFVCAFLDADKATVPISNSDPVALSEHENDATDQNRTKGVAIDGGNTHKRSSWILSFHFIISWIAIPVAPMMTWTTAVIKSQRSQPAEGKVRIEWTCTCGKQIWDDFTELRSGAAETYKNYLNENAAIGNTLTRHMFQNSATDEPILQGSGLERLNNFKTSSNGLTTTASYLGELRRSLSEYIDGLCRGLALTFGKALQPGIPLHHQQRPLDLNIRNSGQPTEVITVSRDPLFLILCHSEGRYATRLLQLDLISRKADCDYALFHILRDTYKSVCGRWSFLSLRRLAWIKFVNFEMYPGNLVDVRRIDDIPPPGHSQYTYDPIPPEIIPPVGDKHLMHLYYNPNCAATQPFCLSRFPKKLRQPLICENTGINPGWGLQLIEAWDIRKFWLLAFALFAVGSLLLGILWTVFKHSVQDAFAIAAYCISLAMFSIGTLQALLVM